MCFYVWIMSSRSVPAESPAHLEEVEHFIIPKVAWALEEGHPHHESCVRQAAAREGHEQPGR